MSKGFRHPIYIYVFCYIFRNLTFYNQVVHWNYQESTSVVNSKVARNSNTMHHNYVHGGKSTHPFFCLLWESYWEVKVV